MSNLKLAEIIGKIEYIKSLKNNWNGYGTKPISESIINKALKLIKELKPIPEVFPTGRGSIQFEWEKDSLYLEMEILEDKIKIFNMANKNKKGITIGDD